MVVNFYQKKVLKNKGNDFQVVRYFIEGAFFKGKLFQVKVC